MEKGAKRELLIHPEELSEKWIDRAVAMGADILTIHPHGGREALSSLKDLVERAEEPEFRALVDKAIAHGLEVGYEFHAASYLLPRELFAEKPELFRMNKDGERTPDLNFCFSSEEALDIVAERAAALAKKLYRSRPYYGFWLDDSRGAPCRCPKCAALSPSDHQMKVMNRIAARLRRDDPDAKVAYLAYQDCLPVPQKVAPGEDIYAEYAPIDRDMHKPIREQGTEGIGEVIATFGKKDAKVLEYWLDNSFFSRWQKPPKRFEADAAVIADDIVTYTSFGFEVISTFACFLGEDYTELYGEPDLSAFAKERE